MPILDEECQKISRNSPKSAGNHQIWSEIAQNSQKLPEIAKKVAINGQIWPLIAGNGHKLLKIAGIRRTRPKVTMLASNYQKDQKLPKMV